MIKNIWQKIKQNHLLLMAICCSAPIILVIGFLLLYKGSGNYWWLIILLCPLMHIFMMREHKHSNSCEHEMNEKNNLLYQCPECGLKYKEKEWAEKCERWCKKHKSCNLEITKHAVNIKLNKN